MSSTGADFVWLTEGSHAELERLRQRLAAAGIRGSIEPRSSCTTGTCSIDSELRVAPADLQRALQVVLGTR